MSLECSQRYPRREFAVAGSDPAIMIFNALGEHGKYLENRFCIRSFLTNYLVISTFCRAKRRQWTLQRRQWTLQRRQWTLQRRQPSLEDIRSARWRRSLVKPSKPASTEFSRPVPEHSWGYSCIARFERAHLAFSCQAGPVNLFLKFDMSISQELRAKNVSITAVFATNRITQHRDVLRH